MSVDFLLQEDNASLFLLEDGTGDILLESSTPNSTVFRSFTQVGRPGVRMVRPANMAAINPSVVVAPQTIPNPGVSQPEQAWWNRTDINRAWMWVGPDQQFEGATRQQTYIFPLSQLEPTRIVPFINYERYIVDAPKRFDGATVQQTFPIPPVSEPEFRYWIPQIDKYLAGPTRQFDGATQQQTYVFPLSQPVLPLPSLRYQVPVTPRFDGATVQQTYIFEPNQPEFSRFSEAQRNRFLEEAVKILDQAAVVTSGQMTFRSFTQIGRPGYRIVYSPKVLDGVITPPPAVSVFIDKVFVGTIFGSWIDPQDPRVGGL